MEKPPTCCTVSVEWRQWLNGINLNPKLDCVSRLTLVSRAICTQNSDNLTTMSGSNTLHKSMTLYIHNWKINGIIRFLWDHLVPISLKSIRLIALRVINYIHCGHCINSIPCSLNSVPQGNPIQGCRHECEHDSECGHQQHCSGFKCVNACDQCGKGADCKVSRNHRAVCECPAGYIGSPYTECRPECYGDRDCPGGRPACIYGICKNPCEGACGTGADCNLRGLTPVCSCPKTHTGNPFVSCRPFTKGKFWMN